MGGIEVEIDVENAVEALAEESGGGEEDDGKGQLDDNEVGAEASPRAGGTACSVGKAGAQISDGEARDRRGRADGQCDERDSGNKEKHAVIEADGLEERHAAKDAFGDESGEEMDSSPGGGQAEGDGERDEKSRFDDQLAGKTREGCAQRAADGHLVAAVFRTDEEQTGDVDAGDEQKKD